MIPEVEEIVQTVLEGLSPEQAAIRTRYVVGKDAVRSLRTGKVGWESTVRAFAEQFADRFEKHYGEAIGERFGVVTKGSIADWFAEKCGFKLPAPRPDLTYQVAPDDVRSRAYTGIQDLSDEDAVLVASIIESLRRKQRGF